jgi:SET domain-containing protein
MFWGVGPINKFDVISAPRPPLRVAVRGSRGRGVFAAGFITAGELVERSPVLIIPHPDRKAVDGTVIFTYVFMWEHGTTEEDLYSHSGRSAIALGLTSLLNHSYTPNCEFIRHIDEMEIDLVALRDIDVGEELTIDYQMTLWFKPEPT